MNASQVSEPERKGQMERDSGEIKCPACRGGIRQTGPKSGIRPSKQIPDKNHQIQLLLSPRDLNHPPQLEIIETDTVNLDEWETDTVTV